MEGEEDKERSRKWKGDSRAHVNASRTLGKSSRLQAMVFPIPAPPTRRAVTVELDNLPHHAALLRAGGWGSGFCRRVCPVRSLNHWLRKPCVVRRGPWRANPARKPPVLLRHRTTPSWREHNRRQPHVVSQPLAATALGACGVWGHQNPQPSYGHCNPPPTPPPPPPPPPHTRTHARTHARAK